MATYIVKVSDEVAETIERFIYEMDPDAFLLEYGLEECSECGEEESISICLNCQVE